ncbi:LPS export ABC transporter periplasmic protein LptC [Massilia sp. W12]|uniref:LPS export ABC transporter periplasmic protein LptC n=1 Tax=Massilia sp. W12 TaxID=3126507 RepID=UPI0030CC3C9C
MSDSASHDRFRLIALLTLAAVITLSSYWLLDVLRQGAPAAAEANKSNDPDYFVENFHVVRLSQDGKPKDIMSGKLLTHRPLNDKSDVQQVQVLSFNPAQSPLRVQARQALIEHQNNRVLLQGEVELVRSADARSEGWTMRSPSLWMLPDDDQMQTDDQVQILSGKSQLHGKGMLVDNAKGQFSLQQQVRASFAPAIKGSAK